jgi:hypothetical protein
MLIGVFCTVDERFSAVMTISCSTVWSAAATGALASVAGEHIVPVRPANSKSGVVLDYFNWAP